MNKVLEIMCWNELYGKRRVILNHDISIFTSRLKGAPKKYYKLGAWGKMVRPLPFRTALVVAGTIIITNKYISRANNHE